jgi:hypothetical protein
MFHTVCDWCRKSIKTGTEPYVRALIEIRTLERDRLNKRVDETEPTRFFHCAPLRSRGEWDRLGLDIEVRSDELGDCCYTRALRAIEGGDFDAPDAGFEWRLLPVGARDDLDASEEPGPFDHEPIWERAGRSAVAGLYPAGPIERTTPEPFHTFAFAAFKSPIGPADYADAGIRTIGDLRCAINEGTLTRVRHVGAKRAQQIAEAVERLLSDLGSGDGIAAHPSAEGRMTA